MKDLILNSVIMIVGSTLVSFLTCVLYLKNKKQISNPNRQTNFQEQREFEDEQEMKIFSTPSKNDKFVVRSKEIEDEER